MPQISPISQPISIGFLGPSGTFSELACDRFIQASPESAFDKQAGRSIPQLFSKLISEELDQIIVPIENSIEGSINIAMDMLVKYPSLFIQQEVICQIHHCLLAKSPYALSEIEVIVSHPQPIAQCNQFIVTHMGNAELLYGASSADAAFKLSELGEKKAALIGRKELIDLYGLTLLAENIEDQANNQTRFVVIGKTPQSDTQVDKTSIVFSTHKDQPGSLQQILKLFSDQSINLTRILSRPSKTDLGEYLFFVDFEGSLLQDRVAAVLEELESTCLYYKYLGSYRSII